MAGTTQKVRITGVVGSDVNALAIAVNKLIDDHDALVTVYNAHTHVENAAASYTQSASVAAVAGDDVAVAATAGKVAAPDGTALT